MIEPADLEEEGQGACHVQKPLQTLCNFSMRTAIREPQMQTLPTPSCHYHLWRGRGGEEGRRGGGKEEEGTEKISEPEEQSYCRTYQSSHIQNSGESSWVQEGSLGNFQIEHTQLP